MDTQESDKRVFFTNEEWDRLALYLIGNNTRYRENIIIPRIMGPVKIKTREEKMVEAAFESCAFKTVMSCVLGKLAVDMIVIDMSKVAASTG
jgi:import inner membrane translocase subunit TIM22